MIQDQTFTAVGKNSKIIGQLEFHGPTQLLGCVEGEIHMPNNSLLVVSIDAMVKGIIRCHNLDIYGTFEGEIFAEGVITFFPTAQVSGKIQAQSLNIYPGAEVNMSAHTKL